MAGRHRTRRKEHKPWGRNATLELVVTALVVVSVLVTLFVFLFIYHDLPFRTS